MSTVVLKRHRGPFTLIAYDKPRLVRGKLQSHQRTVAENVEVDEVEELACMVLTDPRDSADSVFVWTEHGQYWVTWYRRGFDCGSEGHVPAQA